RARPHRRDLQCRRRQRAQQPRRGRRDLRRHRSRLRGQRRACRALSVVSGGLWPQHPHAYLVRHRPSRPRSPLCDRREQAQKRARHRRPGRLRRRTCANGAVVSRARVMVARRHQRRLQDLDRQELWLPDRGLRAMRILVLNADYPRFLDWFYARQPDLKTAPYAAQMTARNASLFGVADFYSRNFAGLGHDAAEIHVNNAWLQSAWAREHGLAVELAEPRSGSGGNIPGWLQRTVAPFKPMLRPLARKIGLSPKLDKTAETILLAQIEA